MAVSHDGLALATVGACSSCSGGVLAYASVNEMRHVLPKPPEVAQDVVTRNVEDAQGRRASFRILLSPTSSGGASARTSRSRIARTSPSSRLEMKAVLESAEEIICVGESSEEVSSGVPLTRARAEEERRAARRADQIALWIRGAISKPVPIRKLNIGQHRPTPTAERHDTSDQRRMVVVLVLDHDDSVNLDQALRSAMAQERARAPIFDTLLKVTLFDVYGRITGPTMAFVMNLVSSQSCLKAAWRMARRRLRAHRVAPARADGDCNAARDRTAAAKAEATQSSNDGGGCARTRTRRSSSRRRCWVCAARHECGWRRSRTTATATAADIGRGVEQRSPFAACAAADSGERAPVNQILPSVEQCPANSDPK